MGLPSSDTATIPASFIAAISAIFSPLLPTDAAPIGQTRTLPVDFARSTINRVIEALSFTGLVLGMQHTAVKPPRAASVLLAGSSTRPFLISSMRGFLFFWRGLWDTRYLIRENAFSAFSGAGHQQKQQCHAHRDAVGHLFEDARLRSIGHFGRNLHPAIHGAGVQDKRVWIGETQPLGI